MKTQKIAFVVSTLVGAGCIVAAAGVLLWPATDVVRRQGPRAALLPLDLRVRVEPVKLDPQVAIDLGNVRDLERARDIEKLIGIVNSKKEGSEGARLRVNALHALANVGGEEAAKFLRSALNDATQDLIVRLQSAAALGRMGDPERDYLRTRLTAEPSKIVREKIRLVLESRKA